MGKIFNKTLSEALNEASLILREHGQDETLTRNFWMMTFDRNLTDLVLALKQPMPESEYDYFFSVLERITNFEPIQYILGYAYFMDEKFKVNSSTLIPREDTAGIIDLVSSYLIQNSQAKILDIGTGTGILAITLAKMFPQAQVFATDISKDALEVARDNAKEHQVKVQFIESDLFTQINEGDFDIIVSNPPYISEGERPLMDESVKRFEPSIALFADNEGLAFYQQFAREVANYMNENGMIVVEIGFQQADSVSQIFKEHLVNKQVKVHRDLNDKDRYVQVLL